jgi:hypothetical protein
VRWEEVEEALETHDPAGLVFETTAVLDRIVAHGDLFADALPLVREST